MLDKVTADHPLECTIVTYHVWWPGPNDPFWLGNQTEVQARTTYYGVGGVPYVKLDGIVQGGSNEQLESQMHQRQTISSPLTIEMSGHMDTATAGTVTARITNTGVTTVSGSLHFALVENDIPYAGEVYQGVFRDFIPSGATGEPISLGPGAVLTRDANFTINAGAPPSGWTRQNMMAIAFVQSESNREIFQTGRIFFELDQPELRAEAVSVDDSVGGDGDGSLDPGEWVSVRALLRNLNPILASPVNGTLSASDPRLIVTDPSGSWPDIAYGQTGQNDADPFTLQAAEDLPVGFWYTLNITVTSTNGYSTVIPVVVSSGSPDMVNGPDPYGYYAYENIDPYSASPVYNWFEIDPNLGGAGTLLTLYGDQTRQVTLPFTFRYEGTAYTTLSIGSNGWVAPGTTTDTGPFNGYIPGPEGPPNMIAAFWTDMQPSDPNGGKVYTYNDAAHHRYIVEYSRVLHATGASPETFEFILYDPAYYPTPTNDGEIILQYAVVSDASTCTVGIENSNETSGIQYLALGILNPTGQGLAAGRAIKFTTVPPNSAGIDGGAPLSSIMLDAWPNPSRGGAQIAFDLPTPGAVTLRVYDLSGALVRTLVEGARDAGPNRVAWDGRGEAGGALPAGVYFFRLNGPGVEMERRIVKLD